VWKVNDGLRWSRKIVGVEDHQVRRFIVHVDDQSNQPAIIFGAFGRARDEDKFAGVAPGAEVAGVGDAPVEVVAEKPRVGDFELARPIGEGDTVDIAIGTRRAPFV
jgi:hypothetical protein